MASTSLSESLDSMIDVVFKCKFCSVENKSVESLREHVKQTHYRKNVADKNLSSGDDLKSSTEKDFCAINIIIEKSTNLGYNDSDVSLSESVVKDQIECPSRDKDSQPLLSCSKCDRSYKTIQGLRKHRKVCQSKKCNVCNMKFKEKKWLILHQESHYESDTFKCKFCDYINPQWTQVKIHMEIHNDPETNKCEECGMKFASLVAFRNHFRFQHFGGKHLCDVCGFEATSKYTLFQHRMKYHKRVYVCPNCNFTCNNEIDFNTHIKERHASGYLCKYCSERKYFTTRTVLHSHMLEFHNGKKCFICDRCNYVAKLRHHLEKHYLMHTGERPIKCQIENCDFATRDRRNFKQHMVTKHSKPGDLICRQCQFVTSNQNDWDVHIALHHMKVFNCKLCDYKASSAASLRRHRLAKHIDRDKMRYPCPQCSYRTNFRESLNKHLLTHALKSNRHRCPLCKMKFDDRSVLKEHINKVHSNQALKILFCETCPYSCKKPHSLRQHMLTHSDVKAHKCDSCDYSSRTVIALKAHKLRKHHSSGSNVNESNS